ncbi:nucleoside hydrolase [uncultured Parabacteroides sp.]|uniref:nucleoside hydrolase n=1 Tax=uncultured Parabacteroides sp. TaxID=512312 RepID=UPI0025D4714F|nr:nucleoside hydrolase [uncultured Parabacteroides sp.]
MKKQLILTLVASLFSLFALAQQRVIVDTDIDSDVDDAGTLAMLYALHKQHKIDLLGTVVTSDDPFAATCVSAFNRFYGMSRLPLGFLEGQSSLTNHSRYTRQISEEFPHDLPSWKEAETATRTYRKLLAESPDQSVVILTIGHLSSLQKLLQSSADQFSPLSGKQLVEAKVSKWYCMGGMFPEGKEANFSRPDPASTVYCLANWTKEVVFCGWEVGQQVVTGDAALKAGLPAGHPVYRAYELYNDFKGRASWDQVTAFLLTDEASRYIELDNAGCYRLEADGSNRWIPGKESNQSVVKLKPGADVRELAGKITALMLGRDIRECDTVSPPLSSF